MLGCEIACVQQLQGKSLSLICGALSWLTDYEEKRRQETAALLQEGEAATTSTTESSTGNSSAEPDWITDFVQKKAERDLVSKLKVQLGCIRDRWWSPLTLLCLPSGGRVEEAETRGTTGDDQKQCSAQVCYEEKSKFAFLHAA